jgi:hypothetical protein
MTEPVDYKSQMASEIANAMKELMSEKHLYQTVRVNVSAIKAYLDSSKKKQLSSSVQEYIQGVESLLFMGWEPESVGSMLRGVSAGYGPRPIIDFKVPHLKLFCPACNRDEAHNPHDEITQKNLWAVTHAHGDRENKRYVMQLFFMAFQCQSCKAAMVSFLVSRDDHKLTMVGRTPMETVKTPACLPKDQRGYFSDALIAFNSGQTLPALFMLRTFIEQYAYSMQPEKKGHADQAISAYMDLLPDDFKSRFPSIRGAYERLSVAIHTANADIALFEEVSTELQEHFDAKRLYKLP